MNSQSNPILIELSEQIPETSITYKFINGPESFAQVASQAKKDFLCLSNLEGDMGNGFSGRTQLAQSGYDNWLESIDEEDEEESNEERLRLIGFLKLIIELAEELTEE
jgi:hypothetical protein